MPPIDHVIYIPVVLLLGLFGGFRFGVRAARQEFERREIMRRQ